MTKTDAQSTAPASTQVVAEKITRTFRGVVVSSAMDKTIVVVIAGTKVHPKYHKSFRVSTRYKVHDEQNKYQEGDTVSFVQCRPLSKEKRWRVLYT